MTAFATKADLAARLKRAVPTVASLEESQWDEALDDASAFLRSVIGWQVYPQAEVSAVLFGGGGRWLPLPGGAVAVTSVTGDGAPSSWSLIDGALYGDSGGWFGKVTVAYTVGLEVAPEDLKAFTCVVASQVLAITADLGSLSATGVASVAIDDYRKAWSQGESAGLDLPARVMDQLRAAYGSGALTTGSR